MNWLLIAIALLLGGFFVLGGGRMIRNALRDRRAIAARERWLTTPGEVIAATAYFMKGQSYATPTGTGTSVHTTPGRYYPQLAYAYTVDGRRSQRTQLLIAWPAPKGQTMAEREQAVRQQYPVGTPITVHYDPLNPPDGLLDKKIYGASSNLILGALHPRPAHSGGRPKAASGAFALMGFACWIITALASIK